MSDFLLWTVSVVAFVLGAFYAGSETAFLAADRIRLRHLASRGNRRARNVLAMIEQPEYFLSAVLVGTNLAVTACTAAFTALATRRYGDSGPTVATAILVPTFLILGEIIPKGLFLHYSTRAVLTSIDALRAFTTILTPIVRAFSTATNLATRFFPTKPSGPAVRMTMEELIFHLGDSREAGLIAEETAWLADRVLELRAIAAGDVMTAIDDVVMADAEAPIESYAEIFDKHDYSRMPVYRGGRENVIGVISVHEYLTSPDPGAVRDHLQRPNMVAADTPITDTLFAMRKDGRHMALIHDDTQKVVGMLTLEDILERFVGAISDEFH